MSTIRHELQDYLSRYFPHMKIDTEHTLAGQITIRFNSAENDFLETDERINQAVKRGSLIFQKLFEKTNHPLWIIAYEYVGDEMFEYQSDYLFKQFTLEHTSDFVTNEESINSRMILRDEFGNEVLEKAEAKITIGKAYYRNIKFDSILHAIANKENGLVPVVGQSVYFFDPINHTGFHMYDDQGIFVWANEACKLLDIYNKYGEWISDYTKEDIDAFFR
jgi:hypothetical protein